MNEPGGWSSLELLIGYVDGIDQTPNVDSGHSPFCLRCPGVALGLVEHVREVSFWECRRCERHFMLHEDGVLTDRWLGAISLLLYGVIFAKDPRTRAAGVVSRLDSAQLRDTLTEIEEELRHPTQPVSRILGKMASSEHDLREYLGDVALGIRARLHIGHDDPVSRSRRWSWRRLRHH